MRAKVFLNRGGRFFFILSLIVIKSVTVWSAEKDTILVKQAAERGIAYIIQNTTDPYSIYFPENLLFFQMVHQVSLDKEIRDLAKKIVEKRLQLYNLLTPNIQEEDHGRILEYMVVATLIQDYGGNAEHYIVAIRNMLSIFGESSFLKDLDPTNIETFDMGTIIRLYFLNRLGIQTKLDYSEYKKTLKRISYRRKAEVGEYAYLMQGYFVTHVVYILSDFGNKCLNPQIFSKEYTYLKNNLKEILSLKHMDLLGEFLSALKLFGGNSNVEDIEQTISLLLVSQNKDGSWQDEKMPLEYKRHITLTSILGLLNYRCEKGDR